MPDEPFQRGLRPVRPSHGHQVGKYGKFLACSGFPVPGHQAPGQGYRRHLPPSAARAVCWSARRQGPHLLRLRALPGLRFYDLGYAGGYQVRKVRLTLFRKGSSSTAQRAAALRCRCRRRIKPKRTWSVLALSVKACRLPALTCAQSLPRGDVGCGQPSGNAWDVSLPRLSPLGGGCSSKLA